MLDTGSFKAAMATSVIYMFDGNVPATADAGIDATNHVLGVVSAAGAGTALTLDTAAIGGTLVKSPSQTWSGTYTVAGTPTFFRYADLSDTHAASTSAKRVQGTLGLTNADTMITKSPVVIGDPAVLNYVMFALPQG